MPQLPIRDPQQSIAVQSTGTPVPRGSTAGARALQGLGKTLESIGDTWLKAKVTNQYTNAKNENESEINQILADAQNEIDHTDETRQTYLDRLNKVSNKAISIDDSSVKQQFDSNNELFMDESRISIEGMFKQKMIANQRGEILKSGGLSKNNYINATSPVKAQQIVEDYMDFLKANKETGYLSGPEYSSEVADVLKWDYDRAMSDIGRNPVVAAQKSSRLNQINGI